MNRAIEFHDSIVESVAMRDSDFLLQLVAYLHESIGQPGRDPGTGWSVPVRLMIERGRLDRPLPPTPFPIMEGAVSVNGQAVENLVPVPFDVRGEVGLRLSGVNGEVEFTGARILIETAGIPMYVEEFPG